jgi:thiamine pyrophosphokinase
MPAEGCMIADEEGDPTGSLFLLRSSETRFLKSAGEQSVRVFIVAGSPTAEPPIDWVPGPDDRVIAADSGAVHARAWGWPVHWLIGDLDSLPPAEAAVLRADGTPTVTAPTAKDETDLELAVARAVADGARQIIICAALGGRPDHTLANVLLLARPELAGLDVRIVEGRQTLRLLRGGTVVHPAHLALAGSPGDLLSLLPLGGDAVGATTAGLAYPLRNETLYFGQARGVSNVFEETEAHIWLKEGMLLVIHTRSTDERKTSTE